MLTAAPARLVLLIAVVGLLWWASGLDRIPADPRDHFTAEQVSRANAYQGPRQIAGAAALAVGLAVLWVLAATGAGRALLEPLRRWPWPVAALGGVAIVFTIRAVVRLPITFWAGHLHERTWGFSTQTAAGWFGDWAKSLGLGIALTGLVFVGLFAAVRIFPRGWPVAAAVGAAAITVVLSFAGPVLLEPVFNRFRPLQDPALASELRALADRAGVPVRDVLVADASRRTTKENAYVSGFGATRRLVLYDTLLRKAGPDEVRLVVAHELGHRRARHVEIGTVIGALGAAGLVLVLWLLMRAGILSVEPADPRAIPHLLLAVAVLGLLLLPPQHWLSRRFERQADRFSLELTGEDQAYVRTERGLALRNLGDLDPGPIAYRFLFTHPAPAERISVAGGRS